MSHYSKAALTLTAAAARLCGVGDSQSPVGGGGDRWLVYRGRVRRLYTVRGTGPTTSSNTQHTTRNLIWYSLKYN